MEKTRFIDVITATLSHRSELHALFLSGSYGSGTQDAVSDLDFLAVADADHHQDLASAFRTGIESIEPIVLWRSGFGPRSLVNSISQSWVRLDLFLISEDALSGRVQSGLKPLHDPGNLYGRLPPKAPPYQPNPQRVSYLITEFLRIMGLMDVALSRKDHVTCAWGLSLLRDTMRDLMLEDCPLADRGGALHLRKLISAEDMQVLEQLPYPGPDREALIAAHIKVAKAFLPRARAMADRLDLDWPEAFETATREHLKHRQGITF